MRENNGGILVERKGLFTRYFIPVSLRAKIIDSFHHDFGYIGVKKMLQMISKSYVWPDMTNDVKEYVNKCSICIQNKVKRAQKFGSLSIIGPAKLPFEIISMDTVGGLDGYQSNQKYLHLTIDHFTRFLWYRTSKNQKADDFRKLLNRVMILGKPNLLISDNYPGITSRVFRSFLVENDIELRLVPSYCAKSNGMIERVNQTIIDRLQCKYHENEGKISWTSLLHQCIFEYNNSMHSSTKFSPRFLLTGVSSYENSLKNKPNIEEALENSEKSHELNKKIYDQKHQKANFNVGDFVLIDNHTLGKLEPRRIGPYQIIEKISENFYRINVKKSLKVNDIVNAQQLTPYSEF